MTPVVTVKEELCGIFKRAVRNPDDLTSMDYRRYVMLRNEATQAESDAFTRFKNILLIKNPQLVFKFNQAHSNFEDYMSKWALDDELTGLGNRRACREHITHLHDSVKRLIGSEVVPNNNADQVAIIALDLNKFKKINDTLGHDVGDEALRFVTEKLQELLPRQTDRIFRPGGDEFIITLEQTDEVAAEFVAAKIKKMFATLEFEHSGQKWPIGTSVGVQMLDTTLNEDVEKSVEANLKKADEDLYRNKTGANDEVANDNQIRVQLPLNFG